MKDKNPSLLHSDWLFTHLYALSSNLDLCLFLQLQQSSRTELLRVLKVLDQVLEPRTFLVGESLSLADMAVAMAALLPFKYVSNLSSN